MHDDTDWFRGYVAGLQEAVNILRYSGMVRYLHGDQPSSTGGAGLLLSYLSEVKREQRPWPMGAFPDASR